MVHHAASAVMRRVVVQSVPAARVFVFAVLRYRKQHLIRVWRVNKRRWLTQMAVHRRKRGIIAPFEKVGKTRSGTVTCLKDRGKTRRFERQGGEYKKERRRRNSTSMILVSSFQTLILAERVVGTRILRAR